MVTTGLIAVPAPSFDFTAERMTRVPIGIRQYFPFPGKQRAATTVARADSTHSNAMLDATEAGLVEAAVRAFYDLAYASTAVNVWNARVTLAAQTVQVAQSLYETGAVPQTDLLQAQLRRAQLEEERRHIEALLTSAEAQLDALRGGSADPISLIALLDPTGGVALNVSRDSLTADTTLARQPAIASPILRVANAEVDRADRAARVHAIAALIGVSLPVRSGREQAPAAGTAELDAVEARQRYDDLVNQLEGELRSAVAELRGLQAQVRQTHEEIIPLANAASTSALQRYSVGDVQFTTVLDTQDDLFRARLRLARLVADYGISRARLAALIGEEWYQ